MLVGTGLVAVSLSLTEKERCISGISAQRVHMYKCIRKQERGKEKNREKREREYSERVVDRERKTSRRRSEY